MNLSELRTKVIEEIERIPEGKLVEAYDLIHRFRVEAEVMSNIKLVMNFAGCWRDMASDTYNEFLGEVSLRRNIVL